MSDEIDVIPRSELKEKIDAGDDFHLVEVLSPDSFREGHLPGAINVPGDELRDRAPEMLPARDAEIVVYCANPSCQASPRAARALTKMGYTNVKDYPGGKEDWTDAGLPLEEDDPAGATA